MIVNIFLDTQQNKEIEVKRVSLHMNDKQLKTARGLIKEICCNYDSTTGGCLLLDRGEVIPCPQLVSQSVICKYFRDVLLDDKRAKELKAEIYGLDHRRVCAACGGQFQAISNRAKYCARCAKDVRLKRQRGYMKAKRS